MKCFLLLVAVYSVTLFAHLTEACEEGLQTSDKLGQNGLLGKETLSIKGDVTLDIGTQLPLVELKTPAGSDILQGTIDLPGTQMPVLNPEIPLGSIDLPVPIIGTQLPLVELKTPVGSGIFPESINLSDTQLPVVELKTPTEGTQLHQVELKPPVASGSLPETLDFPGTQVPQVKLDTPLGNGGLPGPFNLPGTPKPTVNTLETLLSELYRRIARLESVLQLQGKTQKMGEKPQGAKGKGLIRRVLSKPLKIVADAVPLLGITP